jgi:hypothetical protein
MEIRVPEGETPRRSWHNDTLKLSGSNFLGTEVGGRHQVAGGGEELGGHEGMEGCKLQGGVGGRVGCGVAPGGRMRVVSCPGWSATVLEPRPRVHPPFLDLLHLGREQNAGPQSSTVRQSVLSTDLGNLVPLRLPSVSPRN